MTYLLMSIPFISAGLLSFAAGAIHAARRRDFRRYLSAWAAATAVLLVLTAVFDNAMMVAGFFDYGVDEISGLRLGLVPAEDFLYPIAGALLLAGVWQMLGGAQEKRRAADG